MASYKLTIKINKLEIEQLYLPKNNKYSKSNHLIVIIIPHNLLIMSNCYFYKNK